jgi:hypothetical protein
MGGGLTHRVGGCNSEVELQIEGICKRSLSHLTSSQQRVNISGIADRMTFIEWPLYSVHLVRSEWTGLHRET